MTLFGRCLSSYDGADYDPARAPAARWPGPGAPWPEVGSSAATASPASHADAPGVSTHATSPPRPSSLPA